MKKVLSIVLCLFLVLGCFPITALAYETTLGDDDETNISLLTEVPELISITVTPPTKTTYNVGDELDTAGMVVTANFSDSSTKDVTSDVTLSGFDSSAKGDVTVTVSYTEKEITKTGTFDVTIVDTSVDTYTIAVFASPSAGGTVSGGGEFEENTSVTVSATANSGYSFVKWTKNGEQVSTDASYTFTATSDRTLVAEFKEVVYTVYLNPGESSDITAPVVQSTTIISKEEMLVGLYSQTSGCFYRGDDGKLYYKLPSRCSFTAPEGKEFDCWEASFGGTFSNGASIDVAEKGNFTITALWKEPDPDPYLTLSIPASININYGDIQTPFDIQVKEAVFPAYGSLEVRFLQSSFHCASHDGTIPFTVSTNAEGVPNGYMGDECYFAVHDSILPFSCQGYINITSEDWAAAKPGSYTATLRVRVME